MYFLFVLIILLVASCRPGHSSSSSKTTPENASIENKEREYPKVLSASQEMALDALNELQISTDEQNRIYSTFAGIEHPCYHSDTLLRMTQGEFLLADFSNCSEADVFDSLGHSGALNVGITPRQIFFLCTTFVIKRKSDLRKIFILKYI